MSKSAQAAKLNVIAASGAAPLQAVPATGKDASAAGSSKPASNRPKPKRKHRVVYQFEQKTKVPRGPFARLALTAAAVQFAFVVSFVLHAALLAIHFKFPDATLLRQKDSQLEVVLVNSKSATRPEQADVRAQSNLDGGGNTDENRRAKTPLPASQQKRDGDALVEAQRRVQQLEAMQQKLMAQAKAQAAVVAEQQIKTEQPEAPAPVSGTDLASSALAIARLEAQIDKNYEEYQKRPRKKFIGARASEYRFAQYVEDWRQKIERVGTLNYPAAARGRLYGSLLLSVIIRSDGTVQSVDIHRSSGQKVLDEAARRIVQLASPYAPFPPDIRRDTDIIEITRTWTFTNGDKLAAE